MNVLDEEMFKALIETGTRLKDDATGRAVVLSGEGRAFCAGRDMRNFQHTADSARETRPEGPPLPRSHSIANRPQYAAWVWRKVPVPVTAAVHGVAFGGGFQVMLGADMRYVAPDAKLSVMGIKWGLVPDMADTALMRRLMRDDVIRELTYTGRTFTGEEGASLGVVTRLTANPRGEALATAAEISQKNPDAISTAERLPNAAALASDAYALMAEPREQTAIPGKPTRWKP